MGAAPCLCSLAQFASPRTMTAPVVDVALRAIIFLRLSVPYSRPRRKNAAAHGDQTDVDIRSLRGCLLDQHQDGKNEFERR